MPELPLQTTLRTLDTGASCPQRPDANLPTSGRGHVGSPVCEQHSLLRSPVPSTGRSLIPPQQSSARSAGSEVHCHVRSHAAALKEPATQPSSPVSVYSPIATDKSPSSSGGSGLSRFEGIVQQDGAMATTTTAPAALDPPAPPTPNRMLVTPNSLPTSSLLAVNPALPTAMQRRTWCLEDYKLLQRLYKGGAASVYKATCLHSGLPVALKVYFLTRVARNVVHMVKREIELHHKLVHPNVIQLYGAFLDGDRIVLVQEYAARGDLFRLLRSLGGRMSEAQVAGLVLRPCLEALACMHARGICHRDIKPENILFTAKWVLKVADLGIAIDLNAERAVTRAGTVDYMAPEVARCPLKSRPSDNKQDESLAYTAAVDIWAVGVLAYELLLGFTPASAPHHLPTTGDSPTPASASPPPDTEPSAAAARVAPLLPAFLSPAARAFIAAALAENPGDRPTARQLLQHPWIVNAAAAAAVGVAAASAREASSV